MSSYFDTSALVKRYDLNEARAARVMVFLSRSPTVFTSTLTAVEVVSTHLATALTIVQAASITPVQLEFWTSDQDQAAAAAAEGLTVIMV
jgi:predicted nucleic acid-binding protein